MQINADWKRKVAVDDVTLWANLGTKFHGKSLHVFISCDSALCKWGEIFTGNYIL